MPKSKHRKGQKQKSRARSKKMKELQDKQLNMIKKLIKKKEEPKQQEPNTLIGPQIILE